MNNPSQHDFISCFHLPAGEFHTLTREMLERLPTCADRQHSEAARQQLAAEVERSRREAHRESEIGRQLHELADLLCGSEAPFADRCRQLVSLCESEWPHPIFEELLQLNFNSSIEELATWEHALRASSFKTDVSHCDLLSLQVHESADRGLCVDASGYLTADLDRFYGYKWPQPTIRVLQEIERILEPYEDVIVFPLAVNIVQRQWLPAYVCLMFIEFLRHSDAIVQSCVDRVDIRVLYFSVLWYSVGTVSAGAFVPSPAPLASVSEKLK